MRSCCMILSVLLELLLRIQRNFAITICCCRPILCYRIRHQIGNNTKILNSFVKTLAGPHGNVWVIGAQNAGKYTLINALAKKEGAKVTKLTEAPVPGTTLGILRIGGILSAKAKMFDTPGLLHMYLLSLRLNQEEQKMIEIQKELRPRSYRIKAGQTIHVGGLARLDLDQTTVKSLYVTVWASPNVSLHMGKTENANEIWNNHVGVRLQVLALIESVLNGDDDDYVDDYYNCDYDNSSMDDIMAELVQHGSRVAIHSFCLPTLAHAATFIMVIMSLEGLVLKLMDQCSNRA